LSDARLAGEEALLPMKPRYWLREIILCANGEPWLAGRTIVPESTLSGPNWRCSSWGRRRWAAICSRHRR
jgi:chorismate--pyruvate lyase